MTNPTCDLKQVKQVSRSAFATPSPAIMAKLCSTHRRLLHNDVRGKCMNEDTKEKLWQLTLEYKHNVYPGDDEGELKTQFEKYASTILCTIDVDATLKDEAWKGFFQSISKEFIEAS